MTPKSIDEDAVEKEVELAEEERRKKDQIG